MAELSVDAYLGVVLTFLFIASVLIVIYYTEKGFPYHTYVTLIIGYFSAFGILLLVPIDIGSIVYDRRQKTRGSYDDDVDLLSTVYNVFFTLVLVLGSFILVFQDYYNSDGRLNQ